MCVDGESQLTSTELKRRNAPGVKNVVPIIGTIQWTSARDDHPNQNSEMGMKNPPTHAGGNRSSGFMFPFTNRGSVETRKYHQNGGTASTAPARMPM